MQRNMASMQERYDSLQLLKTHVIQKIWKKFRRLTTMPSFHSSSPTPRATRSSC